MVFKQAMALQIDQSLIISEPITSIVSHYIETSHLLCKARQFSTGKLSFSYATSADFTICQERRHTPANIPEALRLRCLQGSWVRLCCWLQEIGLRNDHFIVELKSWKRQQEALLIIKCTGCLFSRGILQQTDDFLS